MNILLTGYNGFIGQNLSNELIDKTIYLIEKEDVKEYINRPDKLISELKIIDVILHNGAISSTSNEDYKEVMYYNVLFTKLLIDVAKKMNIKMIFASSASIYGNSDYPQNLYAWSKMISEDYGRAAYPDGFTSLRYFNVYGPHEEHKGKMSSIVYQAYKEKEVQKEVVPFMLFPKKPLRDFIYVKDVVSANIAAIKAKAGIYEVGTGNARTFEDFLDNMGKIPYTYTDESAIPEWYQYFTEANSKNWLPNWKPEYGLEEGCADYLKYLNNER